MQVLRDPADAAVIPDPELRHLVTQVFANVSDCPEILGFILVVEPGDTLAMLDAQLGFSILANRQEFILEHDRWFELVYVFGQDGSGIEVFVPKALDLPELLAVCVAQASPAASTP